MVPFDIEVLDCNWESVQVYQQCQLTYLGMGECIGLSAREAESAARMLGVPRKRRAGLLDDLQIMGRAAARVLNNSQPTGTRSK